MNGYVIWDTKENRPANRTIYVSGKLARRRAEKLNLAYGAHRYFVKSTKP